MLKYYRIGVVGFSGQKFDKPKAIALLNEVYSLLLPQVDVFGGAEVVSGLTDMGIPAIAYRLADIYGWRTAGVACELAYQTTCYPCARVEIVSGIEWGCESERFLAQIDALIRIGGGKQSLAEIARAKELGLMVIERDMEAIA